MDILKILETQSAELIPEDLDFFETELATGEGYDAAYQSQCRARIKELRAWMNGGTELAKDGDQTQATAAPKKKTGGVFVDLDALAPKDANPAAAALTPAQIIFKQITAMRRESSYKTKFKAYVAGKSEIDSAFIDTHYAFFQPWELDAIISVKQMTEDFLEKYFGALDHDKIARYQQFSEGFFMKHYSQMDVMIVLEHGKNEWRKKENRSKQLDIFLRLKGVKI